MPIQDRPLAERLPADYRWLSTVPGPPILREALALYGVQEVSGAGSNPEIIAWRDELISARPDLDWVRGVYTDDGVPWCGLFVAICAHRAGHREIAPSFLSARAWRRFGTGVASGQPVVGDMLVFWRGSPNGTAGHVGFYVGEDATHYHVLGGNQSDAVSIMRVKKIRLLYDGVRRPLPVKGGHPGWGRSMILDASAADDTENEA
jgi:uncharacterized protein (TIGR02594 family)